MFERGERVNPELMKKHWYMMKVVELIKEEQQELGDEDFLADIVKDLEQWIEAINGRIFDELIREEDRKQRERDEFWRRE